jgi:hypothetical protein
MRDTWGPMEASMPIGVLMPKFFGFCPLLFSVH